MRALLHLAGPVQVLLLLGVLVESQEGVAVPRRAVADPVALPEQPSLPDHLPAVQRVLQILLLLKHLGQGRRVCG